MACGEHKMTGSYQRDQRGPPGEGTEPLERQATLQGAEIPGHLPAKGEGAGELRPNGGMRPSAGRQGSGQLVTLKKAARHRNMPEMRCYNC